MKSVKLWVAALAALLGSTCAPAQDFLNPAMWEGPSLVSDDGKILGLFTHSDHAFTNFISPMTNPVYFEDPRTLSEIRTIFINHHLPNSLGGDNVQVYAAQIRAALTENLSLIATKDGYIVSQSPVLDDGFADVSVGLKYNIFKDACSQTILSGGLTYELPVGSTRALQGNGDGEFHLFATGGTEFLPNWHYVSGTGLRLPANRDAENQVWYWSHHLDKKLGCSPFYLFTEANWYHYMSSADEFPLAVGGMDLFNFGAPGIAGNDVVTGAWGFKYKPGDHLEVGVAYEIPYTNREDILKDRLTVDLILRY